MIKVRLGSNATVKDVIADPEDNVKKILEDNGVDYSSATVTLDSVPLDVAGMNKSLKDLGVVEKCILASTVKHSAGR